MEALFMAAAGGLIVHQYSWDQSLKRRSYEQSRTSYASNASDSIIHFPEPMPPPMTPVTVAPAAQAAQIPPVGVSVPLPAPAVPTRPYRTAGEGAERGGLYGVQNAYADDVKPGIREKPWMKKANTPIPQKEEALSIAPTRDDVYGIDLRNKVHAMQDIAKSTITSVYRTKQYDRPVEPEMPHEASGPGIFPVTKRYAPKVLKADNPVEAVPGPRGALLGGSAAYGPTQTNFELGTQRSSLAVEVRGTRGHTGVQSAALAPSFDLDAIESNKPVDAIKVSKGRGAVSTTQKSSGLEGTSEYQVSNHPVLEGGVNKASGHLGFGGATNARGELRAAADRTLTGSVRADFSLGAKGIQPQFTLDSVAPGASQAREGTRVIETATGIPQHLLGASSVRGVTKLTASAPLDASFIGTGVRGATQAAIITSGDIMLPQKREQLTSTSTTFGIPQGRLSASVLPNVTARKVVVSEMPLQTGTGSGKGSLQSRQQKHSTQEFADDVAGTSRLFFAAAAPVGIHAPADGRGLGGGGLGRGSVQGVGRTGKDQSESFREPVLVSTGTSSTLATHLIRAVAPMSTLKDVAKGVTEQGRVSMPTKALSRALTGNPAQSGGRSVGQVPARTRKLEAATARKLGESAKNLLANPYARAGARIST